MIEEIELKISGTKEEIEKHLLNQGFSVFFKRRTIANYYLPPNEEIGEHKTLKDRCVRLRTSFKIDEEIRKLGFRKLDLSESQDEEKLSLKEAKKLEKQLLKDGYQLIHTDDKTDFVYILKEKDLAFQIQDIEGLGIIVAYDNKDYYNLPSKKQREKLIKDVEHYGIKIQDYNQVDRFTGIDKSKKFSIKEIVKVCKNHNATHQSENVLNN